MVKDHSDSERGNLLPSLCIYIYIYIYKHKTKGRAFVNRSGSTITEVKFATKMFTVQTKYEFICIFL